MVEIALSLVIGLAVGSWISLVFVVCPKVDVHTKEIDELKNKVE